MGGGEFRQGMGSPSFGPRNAIGSDNTGVRIDRAGSVRIHISTEPKGIDAQSFRVEKADSIERPRQSPSPRSFPSEPRSTNQTEQLKRNEKMGPGLDRVDNIRPPLPPRPPGPRPFSPERKRRERMSSERMSSDIDNADNARRPRPPRPGYSSSEPRSTNQTEPKRKEKVGSGLDRVDNIGPPRPPHPLPSRPFSPEPKQRKKMSSDIGYIWPKDPRPGNPSRWSPWQRFTDVMTGKGPDIYVGRIRPRASHHDHGHTVHRGGDLWGGRDWERRSRTGWLLWENDHAKCCTRPHCPDCYYVRKREKRDNLLFGARRDLEERYDFRTRRYQVPDEGTWSRVEYCDERRHTIPLCYWDRYGRPYPAAHQHDRVYGGRCRRFRY